eukprot:gene8044-13957_t
MKSEHRSLLGITIIITLKCYCLCTRLSSQDAVISSLRRSCRQLNYEATFCLLKTQSGHSCPFLPHFLLCPLSKFYEPVEPNGKPGKCPDTRKGFELAKVGRCTGDFDCLGPEKCCRNGDVQTCQSPEFIFNSSFPPVPIDVKARKKSSSSLLLSWGLPQNSTWVGVIVFVIEFRHASRVLRPTNNDFSFWSFAGQTSSLQKTIKSLVPGEWYQLRVIAYSLNGTNGYSQPSAGFRLDVEVRRPSPPRNFKASNAWFQNKKIFVNVTWTPPLFPDLPVRRYRIIYNKHVDGSMYHYDAIPLRRTKISGKETSTILKNLDPSSIYVVKIQAMLSLRRKKIKGQWGTMYLKTPPLQSREPLTTRGTLSNTGFSEIVNSSVSIKCTQVIHTPNGFSKIILQWSVPVAVEGIQFEYEPEKCKNEEKKLKSKVTVSAKDDSLTIEDLYQNCNYFVKMALPKDAKLHFPDTAALIQLDMYPLKFFDRVICKPFAATKQRFLQN